MRMENVTYQRIALLREVMRREHLAAFVFPSTDPHHSEYVADHWKCREWISGFNGSAGIAVVTLTSAALWTDSRYFLAAAEQLKGSEFVLMKEKVQGTPTIPEWLGEQLRDVPYTEIGVDGMVNGYDTVEALKKEMTERGGITVRTNLDPLATIWEGRPPIPEGKVEIQPMEFAGERVGVKIKRVRKALREMHADGMLVSALDDIAWLLNLRGTDVHCNPVFVSYLLISTSSVTLYINKVKLMPEVVAYLRENEIGIADYEAVGKGLRDYFEYNILFDAADTNYSLAEILLKHRYICGTSPVAAMKIVKNKAEILGYRHAMLRDGVAMVKFLTWLRPAVEAGGQTEMSIDRKLTSLRAEQPRYRDISFDTIAGYMEHGAIVHYEATPETDMPLRPEGLILIDSGAQYQDGTTDITRTIALGPVTEEMKHIYTLVLKGHIQLEMAKFPDGASGTQLDILARKDMWREGLNYLHCTGHGVGSYLNVHEGPHQIRMEWKPTPLRAGMTVTDEPGLYLAGKFGVRIENTLLIKKYMQGEFGDFLEMESLTLCPIDTAPVDVDMLLPEELEWLNDNHRKVYEMLSPYVTGEEQKWLLQATKPLKK